MIAGSARGVRLQAASSTRPLGDRVKQSAFGILEPVLEGARFLDLFAGSGAAGIEALSRGAAAATFVERDQRAATAIEANLASTDLGGPATRVVHGDVEAFLDDPARSGQPFDVVFVDPPYADTSALARILDLLGRPVAPLSGDAIVVAKHFWRDRPPATIGLLASEREERFGETSLTFYRRLPAGGADEETA